MKAEHEIIAAQQSQPDAVRAIIKTGRSINEMPVDIDSDSITVMALNWNEDRGMVAELDTSDATISFKERGDHRVFEVEQLTAALNQLQQPAIDLNRLESAIIRAMRGKVVMGSDSNGCYAIAPADFANIVLTKLQAMEAE